jgi:hypothetical protein
LLLKTSLLLSWSKSTGSRNRMPHDRSPLS